MFAKPKRKIQSPNAPRLLYVSSTHELFFHGLTVQARALGFQHCGYMVGVSQSDGSMNVVVVSNYCKSWQSRYEKNGYLMLDPTVEHAKSSSAPLAWSPTVFERTQSSELIADARGFGFNHGWTYPIHDTKGHFGALTLARDHGKLTANELKTKQSTLQWLTLVTHEMLYRSLLARYLNANANPLTDCELQVLRIASAGKTAGEIALACHRSERTVNFHLGNAMKKLGAENRTQAVVIAMQMGLLN